MNRRLGLCAWSDQMKLSTLSNVIESNEQKRMPEQSVQSGMKPELAHDDQVYIILNK